MASSPTTSCQIERKKVEAVTDFLFLHSKITADSDCSHEVRRHLLLGRKAMIRLNTIFKSRDITLLTEVCLVKAVVFPVVTYGWEKAVATYSSTLTWKTPWAEEPGRLQSMGLLGVGHS